jgi:hypothetical protein
MRSHRQSRFPALQLTPLAACVAAIFTLASSDALAGTVTNCMDSGPGSLRAVVAAAADSETIDMTGLALVCSTISLKTGAITILQNNLNLNGPGVNNLSVSGKYATTIENDRIFNHQGSGLLHVQDLSIIYGSLSSSAVNEYGGCIYSRGSVFLSHVNMYLCKAHATGHVARGGAIFTANELTANYSTIVQNEATGDFGQGGGAFIGGNFSGKYSSIANNTATGVPSYLTTASGGGLYLGGSATITGSTISGNHSSDHEGGINIASPVPSSHSAVITNSTISGNSAGFLVGGISSNIATTLQNSTIAFNTAGAGYTSPTARFSPGLAFRTTSTSFAVNLQSSLLSNNTYGSITGLTENDFSILAGGGTTITVSGANNLVRRGTSATPADTIHISCPLLGPLRNNGGPTLTHALSSRSPAIDTGNDNAINPVTALPFAYDQRRSPHARALGGAADIGAYEVDQVDSIFNTGLEGCPA